MGYSFGVFYAEKQTADERHEKRVVTLCPSLLSLTLRIEGCEPLRYLGPPFPYDFNSTSWCRTTNVLQHLPNSTNRLALVFVGNHDCRETFSSTDWAKVGKQLCHLQHVTVKFPSWRTVAKKELGQLITRELAGVLRAGVLSYIDTSYH